MSDRTLRATLTLFSQFFLGTKVFVPAHGRTKTGVGLQSYGKIDSEARPKVVGDHGMGPHTMLALSTECL